MSKIYLIIILSIIQYNSLAQVKSVDLQGAWSETKQESSGLLIFRDDGKYLIYNDMGFVGSEATKDSDIYFDNKMSATALVEVGQWTLKKDSSLVVFSKRNFVKDLSNFNQDYGKRKSLAFSIKQLDTEYLELCLSGENRENKCDAYERHSHANDVLEASNYRKVEKTLKGEGSIKDEILLSGFESELCLSYNFFNEADQLIIKNRSDELIFKTSKKETTGSINKKVVIKGVTLMKIEIKSETGDSEWKVDLTIR